MSLQVTHRQEAAYGDRLYCQWYRIYAPDFHEYLEGLSPDELSAESQSQLDGNPDDYHQKPSLLVIEWRQGRLAGSSSPQELSDMSVR